MYVVEDIMALDRKLYRQLRSMNGWRNVLLFLNGQSLCIVSLIKLK